MKKYIISYDLIDIGNYTQLIESIKGIGVWAKPLESFWIVKTDFTSAQIRSALKDSLDNDDKIFIVEMGTYWASYNISEEVVNWLNSDI